MSFSSFWKSFKPVLWRGREREGVCHTLVTIVTRSQERHKGEILQSNSRWQQTPQLIKKDRIRGNLSAFSDGCHDRDDVRCNIISPSQTYLTGMTRAVTWNQDLQRWRCPVSSSGARDAAHRSPCSLHSIKSGWCGFWQQWHWLEGGSGWTAPETWMNSACSADLWSLLFLLAKKTQTQPWDVFYKSVAGTWQQNKEQIFDY